MFELPLNLNFSSNYYLNLESIAVNRDNFFQQVILSKKDFAFIVVLLEFKLMNCLKQSHKVDKNISPFIYFLFFFSKNYNY